ncbi:hypothetical protein WDV85_16545 [Pseudokineococcus sp. 5B2Z-1]|uniref:hypothetical protein n=1 Tax=Pseudokineococcus sp. 5B2Z-1 TaxID=3132744 RepID=UPI0030A79B7E
MTTTDAGAPTGVPAAGAHAPGGTDSQHDSRAPRTGWAVTITADTGRAEVDEDAGGRVLDALAGRSPGAVTIEHRPGPDGTTEAGTTVVSVTFDVTDAEAADAAGAAAASIARDALAAAGLPVAGDLLELSVMTWAEQERRLDELDFPELLGVAEVQDMFGVSKQRLATLRKRPGFPEPIASLRAGPVWTAPSLARFLKTWNREGGRPRTSDTAAAAS